MPTHRSIRISAAPAARIFRLFRIFCLCCVFCLFCGCMPAGEEAGPRVEQSSARIINGTLESGYLGVGGLLVDEGGGYIRLCTAATIAEDWVITTADCVENASGTIGALFMVGTDVNDPVEWYNARSIHIHPSYPSDPEANIALVGLTGLDDVPTYPLNNDSAAVTVGLAVDWVGFGVNVASPASGDGIKRKGSGTVATVSTRTVSHLFGSSLPCSGDVGAPTFASIGGQEKIIAVVSGGDVQCSASSVGVRVDAYAAWIELTMSGSPVVPCDPMAAECGDDACYPAGEVEFICVESAGLAEGGACDPSQDDWRTGVECEDGAVCVETSPGAGICREICFEQQQCQAPLVCEMGALGFASVGACVPCVDADNDGSCADVDCDDDEPAAHPGAQEVCDDNIDNDCDGFTDADDDDCSALPDAGTHDDSGAGQADSGSPDLDGGVDIGGGKKGGCGVAPALSAMPSRTGFGSLLLLAAAFLLAAGLLLARARR